MERYIRQSVLRKIILWCASLFVVVFIVHMVLQGIHNSRELKDFADQQKAFYAITDLVQNKPADNSRNDEIAKQAGLLGDKANVIITDAENKVVYSLNRNFMSDDNGDKFELERAIDIERRGRPVGPPEGPVVVDGDKRIVKSFRGPEKMEVRLKDLPGGFLFSNTKIQVRSEFIDSKKWNLYVISAEVSKSRFIDDVILKTILWLSLMIYWLLLPIWVFREASRRYNKPALWSLLVLVTNIFGLIAYLALRQKKLTCTNCDEPILPSYSACPNCGTNCKITCHGCQNQVDPSWSYCAYCSEPLQKQAAAVNEDADSDPDSAG